MYRIEPVTQHDIPIIGDLIRHTIKVCYPLIYPSAVIRFFLNYHNNEQLKARQNRGGMVKLIANDKIHATGFLHQKELGGVYVAPSCQNNGFGSAIVHQLLQMATSNNQNCVWLDATPSALPFYLKKSFTLVSPMVMYIENEKLAYYKMQKNLVKLFL